MKKEDSQSLKEHKIVSNQEWIKERKKLMSKEKEFTRLRDELSARRRDLPWEKVNKEYVFDGPDGKQTLAELFDGRSQLVIYHFMFGPNWKTGCPHCSFWADNFNGIIVHLNQRDVTMIAVSRAPYNKLAAYEKRMCWNFKWVSSSDTDFNFDYQMSFTEEEIEKKKAFYNFTIQDPDNSEREGVSVFYKDKKGNVFHTYSAYARGIDMMNTAYHYLDLVPKGRDEGGNGQFWVRRHDEYIR
ncbi:MAG TPA: thioredoxin family protein [Nitrosopumilaceae archaeon]|nr:thioredoxin family protein [Nitrosopumilaceae archaeon]